MQRRWNGLEMVKCLVSDVCSRILVVLILNGALATSFAAVDKDQPIRVVTVPIPGLLDVDPSAVGVPGVSTASSMEAGIPRGMIGDLLRLLGNTTGMRFLVRTELEFGREIADGKFNGAVGELVSGKADLLAGVLEATGAYHSVLDFTTPLIQSTVHIVHTKKYGYTDKTKIAIMANTATRDFLERSSDPKYRKLWKRIKSTADESLVNTYDQAMKLLNSGDNWAFVGRTPAIDNSVRESNGALVKDPMVLRTVYGSFAVPIGSPLRQILDTAIAKLQDNGKLDGLLQKYFPNS